jgi:hypothetical protein
VQSKRVAFEVCESVPETLVRRRRWTAIVVG